MIPDLFPLPSYQSPTNRLRTILLMAVGWGVPMFLVMLLTEDRPFRSVAAFAFLLVLAVGGALLFGLLWAVFFGRSMQRLIRQLYEGERSLVPAPPPGDYQFRVMASRFTTPRFAVGGHLYVGPTQLAFVPHTKNRVQDRAPLILDRTALRRVEPMTRRLEGLGRLFAPAPLDFLRVEATTDDWLLRLPEPDRVESELRKVMALDTAAI